MPLTLVRQGVRGDLQYRVYDYTGPTSYATGGEALTLATLGLARQVAMVTVMPHDATVADAREFQPIITSAGFTMRVNTAINTEAANASNQSAASARVMVEGW
jgi:hypothetical protein